MRYKDEPLPGRKVEKRKKRRWDRKPEVIETGGLYGIEVIEIMCEVPHKTFRERKKKRK